MPTQLAGHSLSIPSSLRPGYPACRGHAWVRKRADSRPRRGVGGGAAGRSWAARGNHRCWRCWVVNAGSAVSVDSLIDALWPGEAASVGARKRLQMTVARLRQVLEPVTGDGKCELRTVGGGYLLALAPDELDAAVFVRQVTTGLRASRDSDWACSREQLAAALALWRGPVLADVAFEDFAQPEVRRLDELRGLAVEGRIEAGPPAWPSRRGRC